MARTKVESELAERVIDFLIRKASKFRLKDIDIIPKAIITEDDLVLEFTKDLNKYITLKNVKSIVIDVIGLHERYVTQIEIYRNGEIVYSPSKNRSEEDVKVLVECLYYTFSTKIFLCFYRS